MLNNRNYAKISLSNQTACEQRRCLKAAHEKPEHNCLTLHHSISYMEVSAYGLPHIG